MKKISLLYVGLVALLIGGAGCNSGIVSPTSPVSSTLIASSTISSSTPEIPTKSSNIESEYRYYSGTIGTKKVRLVYWPNGPEDAGRDRWFFDGMYVYEGESTEPLRLMMSFTSGGHFSASGYQIIHGETASTSAHFESTDECDGANEKGILCGELTGVQGAKKMPFNFIKTDKFVLEDYLKK